LALLALFCGCASPEARIRRNPELFESFPPEAQEAIRQGTIEVGFTPEMVKMALGGPARVLQRRTAEADTTIWSYSGSRYRSSMRPVDTHRSYRDRHGRLRTYSDWTWVDAGQFVDYEVLRVEFRDGKVVAIETPDGGR